MKKFMAISLALLLITIIATACANNRNAATLQPQQESSLPQDGQKISVVATIFPLYDFARAVSADQTELSILLKPGAETHSYEPSPADIVKIQNADVFLYIGGESDTWVDRILDSMDTSGKKIVRLMDCVMTVEEEIVEGMDHDAEEEDDADEEHEEHEEDEHIWTSPLNAILMASAIADALAEADPDNAELYRNNQDSYCAQLQELHKEFEDITANAQRRLLLFGDRFPFRYFADAYGLEYRAAFPGCSTDTEASAGTLAYLMDAVNDNQLPYIYYIEMSNENIARAICEQTGAERLLLYSCQSISKENFDAGLTYVDLMWLNANTLRKGLN